jgi:hypothetical protein
MKSLQIFASKSLLKSSLSITAGLIACLLTIFFAHYHLIPATESFNPVKTCSLPPSDCWDGYNKEHYKCVTYERDTVLRTGQVISKGTRSCYKSIYFNLDSTTMYIFGWLLLWATITSRSVEGMVNAVIDGKLRKRVAVALILSIPSIWYVCSVPMHYLNDRYFPYYSSQLYFSLSELVCTVIAILHIRNDFLPQRSLLVLLGGSALAHIIQLVMDEPLLITSNPGTTFRNLMFFAGDVANLAAAWTLSGLWRRKIIHFLCVCVAQLLFFRLIFADQASYSISTN